MKIIRTLKLKYFNGELDNLNEFDAKLLKILDGLSEIGDGDIIRFVKNGDSHNIFAMQISHKSFWYDRKTIFLLGEIDVDIVNNKICLFLDRYLDLKEFKKGIYSSTRTDDFGLPHFQNIGMLNNLF